MQPHMATLTAVNIRKPGENTSGCSLKFAVDMKDEGVAGPNRIAKQVGIGESGVLEVEGEGKRKFTLAVMRRSFDYVAEKMVLDCSTMRPFGADDVKFLNDNIGLESNVKFTPDQKQIKFNGSEEEAA